MNPTEEQLWDRLWRQAGCQGDSQFTHQRLLQAYAEPQRHYHNLQHLGECLTAWAAVRELARQPAAVEMAIWFHDAVYDPQAADNEEKSAALATQCLTEAGADTILVARVSRLVLATKRHDAGADPDAAWLSDVDLGILGQPAARFQEYEEQIRREYAWVPVQTFAVKRAAILRQFLARERIYATDFFQAQLEATARTNLADSVRRLEARAV